MTFNTLLSGFTSANNISGAHSVLAMMRDAGVAATPETHRMLMGMYVRTRQLERAKRLFDRMAKDEQPVGAKHLNTLRMWSSWCSYA